MGSAPSPRRACWFERAWPAAGTRCAHQATFAVQIETWRIPATHSVVRLRVIDLCQWLFEEHKARVAKRRPAANSARWANRHAAGMSASSRADSRHGRRLNSLPAMDEIARDKGIRRASEQICSGDEAGAGEQDHARRWARHGT